MKAKAGLVVKRVSVVLENGYRRVTSRVISPDGMTLAITQSLCGSKESFGHYYGVVMSGGKKECILKSIFSIGSPPDKLGVKELKALASREFHDVCEKLRYEREAYLKEEARMKALKKGKG